METLSVLIGLYIGFAIGYALFFLLNNSKTISKEKHAELSKQFNETKTALSISDDRLSAKQQDYNNSPYGSYSFYP
jgi:uncharacterized membrane-anchored protein YhcB (DUF1043 family)